MSKNLLFPLLAGAIVSKLFSAEVVILEEDFEGLGDKIVPGSAVTTSQVVADPEVGGTRGNVLEISLNGSAHWAGLDSSPQRVALLPLGIAPGTDTFEFTADVFIPSASMLTDPDSTGLRVRWTDELESGKTEVANQKNISTLARDEWITLTLSGNIPSTFGTNSDPTTHVRTIYSIRDHINDPDKKASGVVMYLDNVRIIANTSGEDPNLVNSNETPFGVIDTTTGLVTRSHTVTNSGLTNDLVIADTSSITGDDAAQYAITTPLPLTIPPGTSGTIDLTFDPSLGAGPYSATLSINSNDLADPSVSLNLSALVVDPTGTDLILNGGFETGNTLGFSTNQTLEVLNAPDDPVHTGNHAAVFTLPGGTIWNAFNLDQTSPPAPLGQPDYIEITDRMIGQPYQFSCWLYRPSGTGIDDDDSFRFIIRWNGITPDSPPWTFYTGTELPTDTWVYYTEEGTVPTNWPEDPAGDPVTSAFFIFSIKDEGGDGAGTQLYFDDIQFSVELADPPVTEVFPEMISAVRDRETGHPTITWSSAPDQTYRLEYSTDLENWLEVDDEYVAEADSDTTSWIDTTANGVNMRYYRVHLNPPVVVE